MAKQGTDKLDVFRQTLIRFIELAELYREANLAWERLAEEKERIKRDIARSVTPEEYVELIDQLNTIGRQQARVSQPIHEYEEAAKELKAWFNQVDRATVVVPEKNAKVEFSLGLLSVSNLEQPKSQKEEA